MSAPYVSYSPGTWSLAARAGRYVLVAASPADEAVHRLWEALAEGTGEVLLTLAAELPDTRFCLVQVEDGQVHVAQDGLELSLAGRRVEPSLLPTPLEVPAGGATLVAVAESTGPDLAIPLESGVVGAGGFTLALGSTTVPAEAPSEEGQPGRGPELWDLPAVEPVPELLDPLPATEIVQQSAPLELALLSPTPAIPAQRDSTEVLRPLVTATRCPQHHLNGPHARSCRVCGALVPPQDPIEVPQPSLGVLVLPDGTGISLDRGAILGRAPRVPDGMSDVLHLINLAAYGRDVSRQHAEIVVRGWHVYVRDLGSANGTTVRDASGVLSTVDPGDVVTLPAGGVLGIAGVVELEFRA